MLHVKLTQCGLDFCNSCEALRRKRVRRAPYVAHLCLAPAGACSHHCAEQYESLGERPIACLSSLSDCQNTFFDHAELLVLLTSSQAKLCCCSSKHSQRKNGIWASRLCEYPMGSVPLASVWKPETRHTVLEKKNKKGNREINPSKERGKKIRKEAKRKENKKGKKRSGSRVGEGSWRGFVFQPRGRRTCIRSALDASPSLAPSTTFPWQVPDSQFLGPKQERTMCNWRCEDSPGRALAAYNLFRRSSRVALLFTQLWSVCMQGSPACPSWGQVECGMVIASFSWWPCVMEKV